MQDVIKNLLYAGIGLAEQTVKKFESTIDELVDKGRISDSEAKKILEEFFEKTNARREDMDDKMNGFVEKFGFTKTSEVDSLRKRIEELESKLKEKPKTTRKTAAASN